MDCVCMCVLTEEKRNMNDLVIKTIWAKPQWYLIAKYNNSTIGRIGVLKRTISINNRNIDVGRISGIGSIT